MKINPTKNPESHMMSFGYEPKWSEGSIKPPIFQTSTFVFESAEHGKAFFELAYGLRDKAQGENPGLIYSRLNNPNLEILENRLCLWDRAEDCAFFESGMSAISTVLLEFVKPGDLILYTSPIYGGTDHFINHYLKELGVHALPFTPQDNMEDLVDMIEKTGMQDKLSLIYMETPANPTNDLFDISMCKEVANYFSQDKPHNPVYVAVDNTYMGPLWSRPMEHGADLVLYSATKYIGGHSDLIAGAVSGSYALLSRIKGLRTFLGNMASPHTSWLLLRSLETLKVRMTQQGKNAEQIAKYLSTHSQVEKIFYLGELQATDNQYMLYKKQYTAPGAMISFHIRGGEAEAFSFLNALKLFKLAVSLGSTESLAQHPDTMTHAGVDMESKNRMGINAKMIRLSIGIEHFEDLIADIDQAFEKVSKKRKILPIENM